MAEKSDIDKRLNRLMTLPSEKKVYFNGLVVSITASDVIIGLELNGQPELLLNTSVPVAKALIQILRNSISKFEKVIEFDYPPLKELEEKVKKNNAKTE